MAVYKVLLTVIDSLGNKKEVDGGILDVDLTALTPNEVVKIEEALVVDNYATDDEVETVVQNTSSIRYGDFEVKEQR